MECDLSEEPSEKRPAYNRRDFFRSLLRRGIDAAEKKTAGARERLGQVLGPISDAPPPPLTLDGQPTARPPIRVEGDCAPPPPPPPPPGLPGTIPVGSPLAKLRILRPPGALPEAEFALACSRCGKCVEACPAQCIQLAPEQASGLPFIVARESPCVVCDELKCMAECPTGALKVTPREQIRMGMALVDWQRCLRHPSHTAEQQSCEQCITSCPLGAAAIGVDEQGRIEVRPGCIGCGLCEKACPTEPTSIWVEPGWERWDAAV